MKDFSLYFFLIILVVVTTSCAPKRADLEDRDFGPKPHDPKQIIKEHFKTVLNDPRSAQYEWSDDEIVRAYMQCALLRPPEHGWLIKGMVNAKNRMGGYTGFDRFNAIIRNDTVKSMCKVTPQNPTTLETLDSP